MSGTLPPRPLRIALFGLPYSPNTGDGVISDCLARALAAQPERPQITMIDLAGRSAPNEVVVPGRSGLLRVLAHLPRPLRRALVRAGLTLLTGRLRRRWRRQLAGMDIALFAGGQILSDADLNFPMKVAAAADCCREAGLPVAIVAAGASRNWSAQGRRLFGRLLLADLRHAGLRDAESLRIWQEFMGRDPAPILCHDPGLLAAEAYGLRIGPADPASPVALGIAAHSTLSLHADRPVAGVAAGHAGDGLAGFFVGICRDLVARGHRVRLFCNGADEDAALLKAVAADPLLAPARDAGHVDLAAPPRTGEELATILAPCKAVVAHRLHACIVGYALRRPILGLSWDSKLDAFFASVGLGGQVLHGADSGAVTMILEGVLARPQGSAADCYDRALAECRIGIRRAFDACIEGARGG